MNIPEGRKFDTVLTKIKGKTIGAKVEYLIVEDDRIVMEVANVHDALIVCYDYQQGGFSCKIKEGADNITLVEVDKKRK